MSRLSPYRDKLIHLLITHRYPLLSIFGCYVIAQIVIFTQHPLIGPDPDSQSYIDGAAIVLHHFFAGDPMRAYGYPIFLAPILLLTGQNLTIVVIAQALLGLLTVVEVYALAYRLTRNKLVATLPAALIALDIYMAQWERMIMTETLVIWVLVTAFLCFERYLSSTRIPTLALVGVLAGWAVLIRPNYIFVPLLLGIAVVVSHLYQKLPRLAWQRALVLLGIAYGIVCGQILINYASPNHYLGLSLTADINLFGKIIEYQMEDQTTDPQYVQLKQDLHQFIAQGGNIPWFFLDAHPQYSADFVGAYSRAIIEHHPLEFVKNNYHRDLYDTAMIGPWPYGDFQAPQHGVGAWLARFSIYPFLLYRYLPWLLLIAAVLVALGWRQLSAQRLMYATLVLFVAMTVCLTAIGNYGNAGYVEYYRLRSPADWAILLTAFALLYGAIQAVNEYRRARSQPAPEEHIEEQTAADPETTLKRPAITGATQAE